METFRFKGARVLNIVDYIGCGKQNAITRSALCALTGLSDRTVRQEIENARHAGYIILNDGDGKGYYLTTDVDRIERQYRQNERRAKAILHYNKHLRAGLRKAGRM